jgi:hypothetical protein
MRWLISGIPAFAGMTSLIYRTMALLSFRNDAKKYVHAKVRKVREKVPEGRMRGQVTRPHPLNAVTSISIFIFASSNPVCIIVAAGRTSPNHFFSTGWQAAKSAATGNR